MAEFQYTMNDYSEIAKMMSIEYLSQEVRDIIGALSKKMGVTIETKPRDRRNRNSKMTDDSWSAIRDFKPTVIVEKKDNWMNDIRGALNKLSIKTYDINSKFIIDKIQEIKNNENVSTEEIKKIANTIFDIASTNKFFSEIYANLYKLLLTEFPEIFTSILDEFINGFTNIIKTIHYVDQHTNYDEFCKYNKENDKRKAISVFITNLVKTEVITMDAAICIIKDIQDIMEKMMNEEGKTNEVEEITENIYLLLTNNSKILESAVELKPNIIKIAGLKAKELPSISSRAIFKYMGLLEKMA